ncbi:hypothetical protein KGO95_01945 [Patescibacteria group bacterium]|nr:hypothetical protein [Patescibacteria group bacterium]
MVCCALKKKLLLLKRRGFGHTGDMFVNKKLMKAMSWEFVRRSSIRVIEQKIKEPNLGKGMTLYLVREPSFEVKRVLCNQLRRKKIHPM